MIKNLRIGCTPAIAHNCNANRVLSGTYPVTNTLAALVVPALRALGYTASVVPVEEPTGFTNLSDPNSLPAKLSALAYDTVDYQLVFNEQRFSVMNFTYPFMFSTLSFIVKKPSPTSSIKLGFLTHPFQLDTWMAVLALIFALTLLIMSLKLAKRRFGRLFSLTSPIIDFLCDFAIGGVLCTFYQAGLKSVATTATFGLDQLPTIDHLTTHVAAGEYKLVVSSTVDFRSEFLNTAQSEDIRRFSSVLKVQRPIVVESYVDLCHYIIGVTNHGYHRKDVGVVYFTIDTSENILEMCEIRHYDELVSVEIPGVSVQLVGLVFSANASEVRLKVDELIFAGFFATEDEINKRNYVASIRKRASFANYESAPADSLSSSDIAQSLWIYVAGFTLSVLAVTSEIMFDHISRKATFSVQQAVDNLEIAKDYVNFRRGCKDRELRHIRLSLFNTGLRDLIWWPKMQPAALTAFRKNSSSQTL